MSFGATGATFGIGYASGKTISAGFGQVPQFTLGDLGMAEIGQGLNDADSDGIVDLNPDLSGDRNVASLGLFFSS